ncbi:MAG: ATP-binding cassette domain-containing protein [Clostridiales bacterium]|nr:ATP-binding cassette domain-containing protein [Clostridiales bacterium]
MERIEKAKADLSEGAEGVIEVKSLTKNYGHGRGVFNVSFGVKKGEVFGFLGPNGAGKSTTMRHLMGFSDPENGHCYINGADCWKYHAYVMQNVGYLPGEVALPEGLSGKGFLDMIRGLRKAKTDRTEELLKIFAVNIEGSVKRMSIGEKRKLAIVAAFMSDPEVLLLDEPTSGLDPVMQEVFIDFVRKEKERGKTILLSSHIFSEVEALCDRIAIIKEGKLVSVIEAGELTHYKRKTFVVTFGEKSVYEKFLGEDFDFRLKDDDKLTLEIAVEDPECGKMIKTLTKYDVKNLVEHKQTLEEYFMHFYKSERTFGGLSNG